jgi:outer membrane protein TolC
VLDAERTMLQAQDQLAQAKRRRLSSQFTKPSAAGGNMS